MNYNYKKLLPFFCLGAITTLSAQTTTFNYTGAVQTYVVPACVTQITVDASGAQGGGPAGGLGGEAVATLPVTPGATLYIYVGGCPQVRPGAGSGGFNGGGQIIVMPCGGGTNDGWGGGGASDVRTTMNLTDRIIVAGGGGGCGWTSGAGGAGGGPIGSDGAPSWIAGTQGFGATQSAGGAGGFYSGNGQSAPSGTLGVGGDAGPVNTYCTGGGGGGGYYGGGGGYVSAGAGGSSYTAFPGSINTSTTAGIRTGDGQILITPVTSTPAPGAITGSNPICTNSSANYSIANVAGATSYTWSLSSGVINSGQGTTTINITPTVTTTISVTATFPCGTSAASTYTLTVNPSPNVGINVLPSATVCAGASVTLSGTNAMVYSWSGGISDGVPFVPATTTTYTVTGSDGVCSGTAIQTIVVNPLPIVNANSTASAVCSGNSVMLSGSGAVSYVWDNNITDGVAFNPTSTATFNVLGTDANGCTNTASITVIVNPLPIVTANSTAASVCTGGSVTLTGGGATSYTWDNSVTDGVSFVPAFTLSYMVTGTDANGCVNTATTTVTVNSLPVVNIGPDVTQCGGTVTLDAGNAGSTYAWSNSTSAQTLVVSASGTYSVIVTNINGCTGSDAALVTIHPIPTVTGTASSNTVCFDDANVALTGTPAAGTWSGTGVTGSSFDPSTAGNGSHVCTYTFTDVNGCTNTATTTIQVNACTGVLESTLSEDMNVFPNPNNGSFTLSVNTSVGDLSIEMIDMQGKIIYSSSEKNVQAGFAKQISLENIANGVYMLRLTTNSEQRIQKISVQQ